MARLESFSPDWISPPGNTIVNILRDKAMSTRQFAEEIGQNLDDVEALLEGSTPVSISTARQLARVLGASVEFWMSRDCKYRDNVARLTSAHKDWLSELPIGDMVAFNWMKPVVDSSMAIAACLRFFDVPSVSVWQKTYGKLPTHYAFRLSEASECRTAAVAAWLRRGEIEAETIPCSAWNKELLEAAIPKIKALTKIKEPALFIPKLQILCAKCGVAVVVVRAPAGCPASGATRFLPEGKALLQLSFRYMSDDQFWFSLFHELGHLLLHGNMGFFIEDGKSLSSPQEQEANDFAADLLVPLEYKTGLKKLRANSQAVIRFAVSVGVSPGIIVGQLQHLKIIGPDKLNGLKRWYKWEK